MGQLPTWPLSLSLANSETKPASSNDILLTLAITATLWFQFSILSIKFRVAKKLLLEKLNIVHYFYVLCTVSIKPTVQ